MPAAVATLAHLLALKVTSAAAQDRAQVGDVVAAAQASTAATLERVYVGQGYTGRVAAEAAKAHGVELTVVKRPAKQRLCFVAQALDRRTLLRLGRSLPPACPRLRTPSHDAVQA